jgi:hypothetical protein
MPPSKYTPATWASRVQGWSWYGVLLHEPRESTGIPFPGTQRRPLQAGMALLPQVGFSTLIWVIAKIGYSGIPGLGVPP